MEDEEITIRVMSRQPNSDDGNEVIVYDNGTILAVFRGSQTHTTINAVADRLRPMAEAARLRGQKVHILVDVHGIASASITSRGRLQARALLTNVPFDKLAVYGRGPVVTLIAYLVRRTHKSRRAQFFRNKEKALKWLEKTESRQERRASLSFICGTSVLAIGLLTLIGWHINNPYLMSWIPELRPMNPVSALMLVLLGASFMTYSAKKVTQLRVVGWITITVGLIALSPLSIDTLLYGDRVMALGIHGQIANSAAICFIAIGVVALVAHRPKLRSRRVIQAAMAVVIGGMGLINVFGQLYAYEWMYEPGTNFVMSFNLAIACIVMAITLMILIAYSKVGINALERVSRISLLMAIVLILMQVVTYAAWSQATARNTTEARTAFEAHAQTIENALQDRFTMYSNLLYGFQGMFLASTDVTQGEFESYYKSVRVEKNYPGLQTLSFISKVDDKGIPAFLQKIRSDKSLHVVGNPNFKILQQSKLDQHYVITYIANSTSPGGTDLGSNSSRLLAFQQAEVKNMPIASGSIKFAATTTSPVQEGFFITVPVAYAGAPTKVIGFVNAVFNYGTFFTDAFDASRAGLAVNIIDANDGKSVLHLNNTGGEKAIFTSEKNINVANRKWLATVSGTADFAKPRNGVPLGALITGQIFSLLLVIIFLVQARGRKEALELVDAVTKDLQKERNQAVASDQKSRAILSSIGDGVFVVDAKGIITVFNRAAETISGYSADEAIGRPYGEVLRFESEQTGKPNTQFIKRALGGHMTAVVNHGVIVRKDGKFIPIADSAAPIRDTSEAVLGAIIVFRDVTKEYELDKAKSEFVSLTSHQLRTPLSAINWYAEMLIKGDAGKMTKTQDAYVKEIFEGSKRMGALVNALLDVSRLEIDKLTTQPEPTDVSTIITTISKELKVVIKNRQQTLRMHVSDVQPVIADPRQLRMIVQNLINNAVKYTPDKGVINVTLRKATGDDIAQAGVKQEEAPYWLFSVQDTGYGIPKDDQSKIFAKLFRAENARALNVEGTGLGLFIVKQVVEKMGGHVWFESIESVGTTFYVVAPIETRHTDQNVYNKGITKRSE